MTKEADERDAEIGYQEWLAKTKPMDRRPMVHAGEVAATLFNDLGLLFRRIQMADAFEAKVTEAAKSPAAWLLLREELNGEKEVKP